MSYENNFSIEFPASRDYIPLLQEFLKDYLKIFDFSKDFSERAAKESSLWFSSVISEEKFLHAMPTVSFNGKISGSILSVKVQTSDKKEFVISLSSQNSEGDK